MHFRQQSAALSILTDALDANADEARACMNAKCRADLRADIGLRRADEFAKPRFHMCGKLRNSSMRDCEVEEIAPLCVFHCVLQHGG